jgi:hypothetical protein
MRAELPTACDIGLKRNAKGFTSSWIGYKLHLDVCEAGIPVTGILTSASTHDSQSLPRRSVGRGRHPSRQDQPAARHLVLRHHGRRL